MEEKNLQKQSELYVLCAASRRELLEKIKASAEAPRLFSTAIKKDGECLSIVCSSNEELQKKLAYAAKKISETECKRIYERSGVYYFTEKLAQQGAVAFLFPGEGSQYQNMLAELSLYFPEVRKSFEIADTACSAVDGFLPSQYVYPVENQGGETEEELWKMEGAIESVLSANYALMTLLGRLNIRPDCLVGHSSGEFIALEQAGVVRFKDVRDRIDYIRQGYVLIKELSMQKEIPEGILVAVGGIQRKDIELAMTQISSPIFIAMENCPYQYVLCGEKAAIEKIISLLSQQGAMCNILPFNRPYHTAWFERALMPLRNFFDRQEVFAPKGAIYSCATAAVYPVDAEGIRALAVQQWAMPVQFQRTIETIYESGARVFVEVGPRGNLTGFVDSILKDKAHLVVPLDKIYRPGILQLNHALGLLAAHGVEMDLGYFYNKKPLTLLASAEAGRNKDSILPMRLPAMSVTNAYAEQLQPCLLENAQQAAGSAMAPEAVIARNEKHASDPLFDAYFQTMENFVAVQGDIMRAYLAGEQSQGGEQVSVEETTVSVTPHTFPLLGKVIELKPRERLLAVREFSVEDDQFLKDHTFGTRISSLDPALCALPILPLTFSIEILAEAATALVPDKILIKMENVRAYKWISFETGKAAIQVKAHYANDYGPEKVFVQIRQAEGGKRGTGDFLSPLLVEGTVVFGDAHPSSPQAAPILLKNEFKGDFSGSEIYPKRLFHGPRFQAVKSINRWGDDGFAGTIEVLPRTELFHSDANPHFVVDPVLLDATGSLLGLWAAKEPWNGFVLFPFQVQAIHFFRQNILPPGEKLQFQLRVRSANETTIVSDIELIGSEGDVFLRMQGWEDRNFYLTKPFHRFFLQSIENTLSSPLTVLQEKLSEKGKFAFCILEGFPEDFFERHHKVWEKMLAFLIFSKEERQHWQSMGGNEKVRIRHLLGRAAAKDAVRLSLGMHHGLKLGSPDIVIKNDAHGKPFASGAWIDKVREAPALSISHTGMVVVAAAGSGVERGIGIDVEDCKNVNDDMVAGAFVEEEQRLVTSINADTREWLTRFWCAKEALCKALGSGMVCNPRDIVVKGLNDKTEKVIMEARQGWTQEFPFLEGKKIEAYTFVRGGLAIAVCLL